MSLTQKDLAGTKPLLIGGQVGAGYGVVRVDAEGTLGGGAAVDVLGVGGVVGVKPLLIAGQVSPGVYATVKVDADGNLV
jgi:hypothetical protein